MPGLLRICTAGSVDDGKSTLIGRLLYDSQAVYEDQVRSVEAATRNKTAGPIDFSLFTDGLRAEREQGITIDVAYRYFATARRKFILADTPGPRAVHAQHGDRRVDGRRRDPARRCPARRERSRRGGTRASRTCSASRASSWPSTRWTCSTTIAASSTRSCDDFTGLAGGATVTPIPMSALHGDNVTVPSDRTPWFTGQSLLEFLETVDVEVEHAAAPFRMPVQLVLRPDQEFRGYAGQIASGTIRPGDRITAWPSGWTSTVARIVTWDGDSRAGARADVGHARPRRRARHQPRRRARGRTDPAPSPRLGQRRVDGRAPARPGPRVSVEAQHAGRDGRGRPPAWR